MCDWSREELVSRIWPPGVARGAKAALLSAPEFVSKDQSALLAHWGNVGEATRPFHARQSLGGLAPLNVNPIVDGVRVHLEWPPARGGEIHGKHQAHVDVMECGTVM